MESFEQDIDESPKYLLTFRFRALYGLICFEVTVLLKGILRVNWLQYVLLLG